jgi:hypothetical protein
VVIPAGRVPNVTPTLPAIFIWVGCRVKEKLLPAKTVVVEGFAHKASAAGLAEG